MARSFDEDQGNSLAGIARCPVADGPYGVARAAGRIDHPVRVRQSRSRQFGSDDTRTASRKNGRTRGVRDLPARFVGTCDLVSIREVRDDLPGLGRLRRDPPGNGKCALVVPDVTGARQGQGATQERLALLCRRDRIERAPDIAFGRLAMPGTVQEKREALMADFGSMAG